MTSLPRLCAHLLLIPGLAAGADDPAFYAVDFSAHFEPAAGVAEVRIDVCQSKRELIRLDFAAPAERFTAVDADGTVQRTGKRIVWDVPARGGTITYRAAIDHRRGNSYDARITESWALLRLDDLFPPARTRTRKGARSVSTVDLTGPAGWSFESRYGPLRARVGFSEPDRGFDRPTGWMVGGQLGVRVDTIAGHRMVVAGPRGQGLHRIDTLAFLRWTVPSLVEVFPTLPDRVLVVRAGQDMWRGGLSGPASLYLHASRPLISENGTSSMLHELVHVAMRASDTRASDWIIEGLAEYYSLELLRRSGGISKERFQAGLRQLQSWADADDGRLRDPSRGADTARAALLFADLAAELAATGASLDQVVRALVAEDAIDADALSSAVETVLGKPAAALDGVR